MLLGFFKIVSRASLNRPVEFCVLRHIFFREFFILLDFSISLSVPGCTVLSPLHPSSTIFLCHIPSRTDFSKITQLRRKKERKKRERGIAQIRRERETERECMCVSVTFSCITFFFDTYVLVVSAGYTRPRSTLPTVCCAPSNGRQNHFLVTFFSFIITLHRNVLSDHDDDDDPFFARRLHKILSQKSSSVDHSPITIFLNSSISHFFCLSLSLKILKIIFQFPFLVVISDPAGSHAEPEDLLNRLADIDLSFMVSYCFILLLSCSLSIKFHFIIIRYL